jgi:hypothetical protein
MALPANVLNKQPHDSIKSQDWNDGFGKVAELDGRVAAVEAGKVNKGGDTITGPMTIQAGLTVWGDFHTQAALVAHQPIEARNGIRLVAGSINLPASSVALDQLGLIQYPLHFTAQANRIPSTLVMEQYPGVFERGDGIGPSIPQPTGFVGFPAFFRLTSISGGDGDQIPLVTPFVQYTQTGGQGVVSSGVTIAVAGGPRTVSLSVFAPRPEAQPVPGFVPHILGA